MITELMNTLKQYDHICWYPSGGVDFRSMLFFSDEFYSVISRRIGQPYPDGAERIIPDLFIYTDIHPAAEAFYKVHHNYESNCLPVESEIELLMDPVKWERIRKLFWACEYRGEGYQERKTQISVRRRPIRYTNILSADESGLEEHDRIDVYGTAYLMDVRIVSWYYGKRSEWNTKLLYVLGENRQVFEKLLEPAGIRIETMVEYRNDDRTAFLKNAALKKNMLEKLGVRYYVSERLYRDWLKSVLLQEENSSSDGGIADITTFYALDYGWWADRDEMCWNRLVRNNKRV